MPKKQKYAALQQQPSIPKIHGRTVIAKNTKSKARTRKGRASSLNTPK